MRLTPFNTTAWLLDKEGEPDADGTFGGMTAEDIIHDDTYRCGGCEGRFTSEHDVCEVSEGYLCTECSDDEISQMSARARFGYGEERAW
jgi:hypothetical protein